MATETEGSRRLLLQTLFGEDAFERVAPPLAEVYRDSTSRIWTLLVTTHLRDRPELAEAVERPIVEVVHSIATRPLSSLDGGRWYLTYDQHLGQVLSRLTRLVLSEVERNVADRYLEKLFAQRLIVAGNFIAGLAMRKPWEGAAPPPPETTDQFKRRSLLVHAQESFVIGHELTHVLLGQVPELRKELAEELFTLLDVTRTSSEDTERKAFEEYWDNSIRGALRRYGITPADQQYTSSWSPPGDSVEMLSRDPALLDECICDFAGSVAGAIASTQRGGPSLTEAFLASGIALHNLRLLQQLDHYARGSRGTTQDEAVFHESVTRLSVHRTAIRSFCTAMNEFLPLEADEVIRQTVAFNESFSAILGDPLLFVLGFDGFVDKVDQKIQEQGSANGERPWSRQQRAFLRGQVGFGVGGPEMGATDGDR